MAMQESGEMYLEAIYVLSQRRAAVRGIDVAEYLGYSKPSVSRAIGLLKKEGFVETDLIGSLKLSAAGTEKAMQIYERHTVLTKLFQALGVDEQTAITDACRIEHYISEQTFAAIKAHMAEHGA